MLQKQFLGSNPVSIASPPLSYTAAFKNYFPKTINFEHIVCKIFGLEVFNDVLFLQYYISNSIGRQFNGKQPLDFTALSLLPGSPTFLTCLLTTLHKFHHLLVVKLSHFLVTGPNCSGIVTSCSA